MKMDEQKGRNTSKRIDGFLKLKLSVHYIKHLVFND